MQGLNVFHVSKTAHAVYLCEQMAAFVMSYLNLNLNNDKYSLICVTSIHIVNINQQHLNWS